MINVSNERTTANQMMGIKNALEDDLADIKVIHRDLEADVEGDTMSTFVAKIAECEYDLTNELIDLENDINDIKNTIEAVYREELEEQRLARERERARALARRNNNRIDNRSDSIC